jgi:nitrite reductase (NADH) large subunit
VRKGDLLCIVDSEDDVLLYTGRFIQFYRENAKFKERTYTFVERLGIERVRAVVVDDSDGLAVQLDTAMQESIAAAYDPWREAIAPKTANQFNSIVDAKGT